MWLLQNEMRRVELSPECTGVGVERRSLARSVDSVLVVIELSWSGPEFRVRPVRREHFHFLASKGKSPAYCCFCGFPNEL